ncbi:hypothetical protein EVAR_32315_1 [Eumeta japonica]|uniref:Uncharacterized protein n=1 Tax=Eumeta variegata TaxID=151549 RepID=A0A4C1ZCM8_EUMVA|nr:hypothetical protein EVAR_32315_1 [Eumeta japonica]
MRSDIYRGPTCLRYPISFQKEGSLPPSPADSGVSDVESSSSGAGSGVAEELKARLQPAPAPPAPFHAPFLPFYQHHPLASQLHHAAHHAAHNRPPDVELKNGICINRFSRRVRLVRVFNKMYLVPRSAAAPAHADVKPPLSVYSKTFLCTIVL